MEKQEELFMAACNNGNLEQVSLLLQKKKSFFSSKLLIDINVKDENGNTPFHIAVKNRNMPIIEYLIQNGADINVADKYGNTALHHAVLGGSLPIIEYLLNNAADKNAKNIYGNTPIIGIGRRFNELTQEFTKRSWNNNEKEYLDQEVNIIIFLLKFGMKLDEIGGDDILLISAGTLGNLELIELLLGMGMDIFKDNEYAFNFFKWNKYDIEKYNLIKKYYGESLSQKLLPFISLLNDYSYQIAEILAGFGVVQAINTLFRFQFSPEPIPVKFNSNSISLNETVNNFFQIYNSCLSFDKTSSKTEKPGRYGTITNYFYKYDLSSAKAAIDKLINIKGPISSNILHLLLKVKDIKVEISEICSYSESSILNRSFIRNIAKTELMKRGNPSYDSNAFINLDAWKI
jgi:hypothetical protein